MISKNYGVETIKGCKAAKKTLNPGKAKKSGQEKNLQKMLPLTSRCKFHQFWGYFATRPSSPLFMAL